MRPWRVACLPCWQRWAMRESHGRRCRCTGALLEIQTKNTTPDKADVRMKAWLEFVGSGSLKRAYGQDYDRDLEALRKDGASLLEANLELAARYRDKGSKLSASVASPALETIERRAASSRSLLESQQSSAGSSERDARRREDVPGAVEGFQRQLGEGADRFGQRPESISGQPGQGDAVLGESTAELLESLSRGRRPVLPPPRCGVIRVSRLQGRARRYRRAAWRSARSARDRAVGDLIERGAGRVSGGSEIQRVFVTNWPVPGGDSTLDSARPAQQRGQTPRRRGKGGGVKARSLHPLASRPEEAWGRWQESCRACRVAHTQRAAASGLVVDRCC